MSDLIVLIMAGGLGKRMESDLPKVLHEINNKPMLVHIIKKTLLLSPFKIGIIVGIYKDIIVNTIKNYISSNTINNKLVFIDQPESLGTGHAIQCCREYLLQYTEKNVLVLSGDVPLISHKTMSNMISNNYSVTILTAEFENPSGYGRIICDNNNKFIKIVEEKDCFDIEKTIKNINTGIYSFSCNLLCKYLPYLSNNNAQQEYYLTDIIEIIKNNENINIHMRIIPTDKQYEIIGVNTKSQLLELQKRFY